MLVASLGDEMYKWAVLFYFARTELAARDVAIRGLLVGSLATGPGAARAKGNGSCSDASGE